MAKDNTTLLLIGGAGALGFAWYKGMLAQFGIPAPGAPPATAAPKQTSGGTTGGGTTGGGTTGGATGPTVPPMGAIVDLAGIAQQVTAKDAYIIPSTASVSQAPSGYVMVRVKDKAAAPAGVVYMRADVAQKNVDAANQAIPLLNLQAKALWDAAYAMNSETAGPMPAALPPVTFETLSVNDLKSITGLSGFGDYQRYIAARTGAYRPVRFVA